VPAAHPLPGIGGGQAAEASPRFPPTLFSIPFGLAGLGQVWQAARSVLRAPAAVADVIFIAAAAVFVFVVARYLARGRRRVLADLRDSVLSPYLCLPAITAMILATALFPYAYLAGRVLVGVFLAVTAVTGGMLTGQWIAAGVDRDAFHPGYFLPTVAGGLVGAKAAADVGLRAAGEASFGVGIICWILIGSLTLGRLTYRRSLPSPLVPTLAIEVAPPAIAGMAYFALTAGRVDSVAWALGGYAVLMALVQLRLVPLYVRLRFSLGFWAFTFSYAAAAADAMAWIGLARPPGAVGYAAAVVVVITGFVAVIGARTIIAVARGQLLPPRQEGPAPGRPGNQPDSSQGER
jgi:tellurite resistance protein